ncbi:MAG: hypothetical protein AAGN35_15740 [Bacteroidota bacterium]
MGTRRMISWAALLGALVVGCIQPAQHSALFTRIVQEEKGGVIRGIELGIPLTEAKAIEGTNPKHDDKWGYVYELNLEEEGRFFVEYITKNPEQRIVGGIIVNIFLNDEGVTTELNKEMEAWLRGRYGVAEGNLGDQTWQNEEAGIFATLRILDDKKSISLNFTPLGGF